MNLEKCTKHILIISTCSYRLHELEFVKPIENIIKDINKNLHDSNTELFQYTTISIFEKSVSNNSFLQQFSHIIICGTALKDFTYLDFNSNELFSNLKNLHIPIFGICAGAQLICKYNDINLAENPKNQVITVQSIQDEHKLNILKNKEFKIYALHSYTINKKLINNNNNLFTPILVETNQEELVQLFTIQNDVGCFFHPEIKNKDIIKNFILNN